MAILIWRRMTSEELAPSSAGKLAGNWKQIQFLLGLSAFKQPNVTSVPYKSLNVTDVSIAHDTNFNPIVYGLEKGLVKFSLR